MAIKGPHLIISPDMDKWMTEIKRILPSLRATKDMGAPFKKKSFQIYVTNEQNLSEKKTRAKKKWEYIIVDGAPQSDISLVREGNERTRCLHIINSPLKDDLRELSSILYYLMPQYLKSSDEVFSKLQVIANANQEKFVQQLHSVLHLFFFGRSRPDNGEQWPQMAEVVLEVGMSSMQKKKLRELYKMPQDPTHDAYNVDQALKQAVQLLKCSNHPFLFKKSKFCDSSKEELIRSADLDFVAMVAKENEKGPSSTDVLGSDDPYFIHHSDNPTAVFVSPLLSSGSTNFNANLADISSDQTPPPVIPLPIEDHPHFDYTPTQSISVQEPTLTQKDRPPITKTYQRRQTAHNEPAIAQIPPSSLVPAAQPEITAMPHLADGSLSITNPCDNPNTTRPTRERRKPSYLQDFHCSAVANDTLHNPESSHRSDIIEEYLRFREYQFVRIDENSTLKDCNEAADSFSSPAKKIFICLLSTRVGVLSGLPADTVILYDSSWNQNTDWEAQYCAMSEVVQVYRLSTMRTFEQSLIDRLYPPIDEDGEDDEAMEDDDPYFADVDSLVMGMRWHGPTICESEKSTIATVDEIVRKGVNEMDKNIRKILAHKNLKKEEEEKRSKEGIRPRATTTGNLCFEDLSVSFYFYSAVIDCILCIGEVGGPDLRSFTQQFPADSKGDTVGEASGAMDDMRNSEESETNKEVPSEHKQQPESSEPRGLFSDLRNQRDLAHPSNILLGPQCIEGENLKKEEEEKRSKEGIRPRATTTGNLCFEDLSVSFYFYSAVIDCILCIGEVGGPDLRSFTQQFPADSKGDTVGEASGAMDGTRNSEESETNKEAPSEHKQQPESSEPRGLFSDLRNQGDLAHPSDQEHGNL
ncbi:hypothetical protein Vadar_004429 [Vaccinium darrowii]|uniref:Uncharacterized protein n=1 Tax=Vaccinium darrowii TaxID=229202 RepID=A0ACB7Z288_9ERIC|nr:hypothetical protein Vadar_004429 [Vaccinium darrowii]